MIDVILFKAIIEAARNTGTDQEIIDVVSMMGWGKREVRTALTRMKKTHQWSAVVGQGKSGR